MISIMGYFGVRIHLLLLALSPMMLFFSPMCFMVSWAANKKGNMVLPLYLVDHELTDFLMKILIVKGSTLLPQWRGILCITSRSR